MKIPALIPALEAAKPDSLGLLKQLQPGQLLQARVATATQQGIAKLLIGTSELLAKTRIELLKGEQLQLRVEKGLPHPELKIIRNDSQAPVRALQLHAMARKLPPAEVQHSLRQLPPQPAQQNDKVQQVLRILLPNAPTPQQVTATSVQRTMQNSGIFFEPRLLKGDLPANDQKFQLLQLLRLFSPEARAAQHNSRAAAGAQGDPKSQNADQLMNRLLRLVESSLGRIQSHQATTLANEEPGRQVWQFDMPIQLADKQDHLQLRVQSDQEPDDDEGRTARAWKVDIEFDFDNLGGIFSRINLRGEEISASFWSQRDKTATLIERSLPLLEKALAEAGLQVTVMSSLKGESPQARTPLQNLLDERA